MADEQKSSRQPAVGDRVIYMDDKGIPRSGTVTSWNAGTFAIYVLRPSGNFYAKMWDCPEDPTGKRSNSWHWPPKENA